MKYKIIAKYIKNLNYKIPTPNAFFLLAKNISNYKINIDIKSNQFKDKIIEVETSLVLNPIIDQSEIIETKITHSTIIELQEEILNKESVEKIILIEVPSEVYSEIRETFIFLFEKSGFKDIKIEKTVDFESLYLSKKSQK
jgi:preprotein translocase subunit SecB|tara:strand:- start:46 stop:468 length:423 start_codon:yes stop_codon:yes gene_type:complete